MTNAKIRILGFVGKPLEIKRDNQNKEYGHLDVAVSEWSAQAKAETTMWYTVLIFRENILQAAKTLTKGAYVLVEGSFGWSKWTKKTGEEVTQPRIYGDLVIQCVKPENLKKTDATVENISDSIPF